MEHRALQHLQRVVTVTISLGSIVTENVPSAPTVMSAARRNKLDALVRQTARGVPGPGSPPETENVSV